MGAVSSRTTERKLDKSVDRRARARTFCSSPDGQRALASQRMEQWLAQQKSNRDQGASRRYGQETATHLGHRVWIARCVTDGRLRFWAVLAAGTRLAITRVDDHPASAKGHRESEGKFSVELSQGDVQAEREAVHATPLTDGICDGYYVALAGWLPAETDCGALLASLLTGSDAPSSTTPMSRANAQALLRRLLYLLPRGRRALDWGWAVTDTDRQRRLDRWLAPPPAAMLQAMLNVHLEYPAMRSARKGAQEPTTQLERQLRDHMDVQTLAEAEAAVEARKQSQVQTDVGASTASVIWAPGDGSGRVSGGGDGGNGGDR